MVSVRGPGPRSPRVECTNGLRSSIAFAFVLWDSSLLLIITVTLRPENAPRPCLGVECSVFLACKQDLTRLPFFGDLFRQVNFNERLIWTSEFDSAASARDRRAVRQGRHQVRAWGFGFPDRLSHLTRAWKQKQLGPGDLRMDVAAQPQRARRRFSR